VRACVEARISPIGKNVTIPPRVRARGFVGIIHYNVIIDSPLACARVEARESIIII
jgi:hypothetical protein